jgi:hypothetical protein
MEHYFLGHVLNDILDKNIFGNSDIKMDAISKPLVLEHLQRKQNNQCLPITFHESISLLIIV